jgi:hypothetical protein
MNIHFAMVVTDGEVSSNSELFMHISSGHFCFREHFAFDSAVSWDEFVSNKPFNHPPVTRMVFFQSKPGNMLFVTRLFN